MAKQLNMGGDLIQEFKDRGEFTPDFESLRRKEYVPLFVYDDWKMNEANNKYFDKHGKYLGKARTHSGFFRLVETKNQEAVLLEGVQGVGYVHGEVWAVPPEAILVMDRIKHNSRMFRRVKRSVVLLDQTMPRGIQGRPYLQCFTYLGIPEIWDKVETSDCAAWVTVNAKGSRTKNFEFSEDSSFWNNYMENRYGLGTYY